jgi:hypothetical protein
VGIWKKIRIKEPIDSGYFEKPRSKESSVLSILKPSKNVGCSSPVLWPLFFSFFIFFAESILGAEVSQNENHQWYIYIPIYIWDSENQQRRGAALKIHPTLVFYFLPWYVPL